MYSDYWPVTTMADSYIHDQLYVASGLRGYDSRMRALLAVGAEPDKYKDSDGNTALTEAAYYGKDSNVSILIQHGADINRQKKNGYTALHRAAASGQNAVVSTLLQAGANPYLPDNDKKTPIQVADNEEIARLG